MSLTSTDGSASEVTRSYPRDGKHHAICSAVYPLGVQPNKTVGQTSKKKVAIVFELDQKETEGKFVDNPMRVVKFITPTLGKQTTTAKSSALRDIFTSWEGRSPNAKEDSNGFDILNWIGKKAIIVLETVEVGSRKYTNILSILPSNSKNQVKSTIDATIAPEWVTKLRAQSVCDADWTSYKDGVLVTGDKEPVELVEKEDELDELFGDASTSF